MDLEQIIKRLEWLDDERRKDKLVIATLENRLDAYESNMPKIREQLKEQGGEISRVAAMLDRFDQIDSSLAKTRVELSRRMDGIEKQRQDHERETEKVRRDDLESLNRAIAEVRKTTDPIPELRTKLNSRVEEEFRLGRLIEELEQKVTEYVRSDEDYRRSQKLLEEGRRQDVKRLTDLQAEVSVLRKRMDEQRGKVDLTSDSVRKIELRIGEIQAAETERRQAQIEFIERQSMANLERDREWKEWQAQFEEISKQAMNLDSQMQSLDATHRAVKRSQESFDEAKQRYERRINEMTEMQRLAEERLRQEWVSFKADDQKRWTNYTLAQEEQQREISRKIDKQNELIVELNDLSQEMQDDLSLLTENVQKRLQSLVGVVHEWSEDFEQTIGDQK